MVTMETTHTSIVVKPHIVNLTKISSILK